MRRIALLLVLMFLTLRAEAPPVLQITIDGAISPASSTYLDAAVAEAEVRNAQLLLIALDTPGGLVSSMREMIRRITNASLPVCVYVAPKGAHAASAGTYLTYAAHIAAMAPGTNIGAATPISMMPGASGDANASSGDTSMSKARNDAEAYIRSLAELRERNVSWGVDAVAHAASLSAEEALRYGVIDLIAEDRTMLLERLDGRSVTVEGKTRVLKTAGAPVIVFTPDWKTELLGVITDPNVAYMLLLIAFYGIFFELMNPGSIFPGVVGAISGVMALYALNLLPFNYAGLLLMLLGIAFMIAEVFIAGFGILGIGGVVAFAAGSLLLFDADTLGSDISLPLILAFSLVSLGFFVMIFGFLWRSRHRPALGGSEEMIGAEAEVLEAYSEGYRVRCHGEVWHAQSDAALQPGDRVRVDAIDELTLTVSPQDGPDHPQPSKE